eukprot:superscaffoldBa00001485_g10769
MKERSGVCLALKALLAGVCVLLLLLSSAGVVFLLFRHKELTEEVVRLDAQMQALAQSCRLQTGFLRTEPGEAGQLKALDRSRRSHSGAPKQSLDKDEKDMLMLMTYSMVPAHLDLQVCLVELVHQDHRADEEKEVLLVQGVHLAHPVHLVLLGALRKQEPTPAENTPIKPTC